VSNHPVCFNASDSVGLSSNTLTISQALEQLCFS
jgi:hypothetical protein